MGCWKGVAEIDVKVEVVTLCHHDIAWLGLSGEPFCDECGARLQEGDFEVTVKGITIYLCKDCFLNTFGNVKLQDKYFDTCG